VSLVVVAGGDAEALPLGELARIVRPLQRASAPVFWLDFGLSVALFWSAAAGAAVLPAPWALLVGAGAVLSGYRCSVFIHELVHLGQQTPKGFSTAWGLLFGAPLMTPLFMYGDHWEHHGLATFGTEVDNEYVRRRGWIGAAQVLAASAWFPAGLYLRALALAPLSTLSPHLRDWVERRASSLGPLGFTQRALATAAERRARRPWSAACTLAAWTWTIGVLTGLIPMRFVLAVALATFGAVMINGIRLLVAHRYAADGASGRTAQLLDAVNYPRHRWRTVLWAPVGLHLHALHHLFPSIPYHNLGHAHRLITAYLPADTAYARAEGRSLAADLAQFLLDRPPRLAESRA